MPHQYLRSELQLVLEDIKSLIRGGFSMEEGLPFYENWLSGKEEANNFSILLSIKKMAILPVIEKGLMEFIEVAEKKGVRFHLNVPPEDLYCTADQTIVSQLFYRLFEKMLQEVSSETTTEIYVSDGNDKCLVEVVFQNKKQAHSQTDNYFKIHRITPTRETEHSENLFTVFSKMIEDMDGELQYQFNREGPDYFRLKLPLY